MNQISGDLAGQSYWDGVWESAAGQPLRKFSYFRWALSGVFRRYVHEGAAICEVGCADSSWVPYFAVRGLRVTGIDYSERGISRLRRELERRGLVARLIAADILDSNVKPEPQDVVFSLGVIEHFRDPHAVLVAMSDLLREGGVLVTLVPNLVGAWGRIEARIAPDIFALHVPYVPPALDRVHLKAGFEILEPARYFGIFGPMVLNAPDIARGYPRTHRIATAVVWLVQQAIAWPAGLALGRRGESQMLSSHVIGIYRKPTASRG